MRYRNTPETYGLVSKILHWLIAVMVLGMLIVGVSFNYLPENMVKMLIPIHKSTGVTLLGLMVLRLLWRLTNPVPNLPTTMPRWQMITARAVHHLFYLLLIAMPITGIVMTLSGGHPLRFWSFGDIHLAFIPLDKSLSYLMFNWHDYLAWTIFALFVLHTAAALKHHFWDKDDVLRRML